MDEKTVCRTCKNYRAHYRKDKNKGRFFELPYGHCMEKRGEKFIYQEFFCKKYEKQAPSNTEKTINDNIAEVLKILKNLNDFLKN